jgi:hypothetical protein
MNQNFYADNKDGKTPCCVVCERLIPDGAWFARLPLGDHWVAVCRPYCLEVFLDAKPECTAKIGMLPSLTANGRE